MGLHQNALPTHANEYRFILRLHLGQLGLAMSARLTLVPSWLDFWGCESLLHRKHDPKHKHQHMDHLQGSNEGICIQGSIALDGDMN